MAELTLGLAITKGIITAGQIAWVTGKFIYNTVEAPKQIVAARNESGIIGTVLKRFQRVILDENASRGPLGNEIQLEDLATVVVDTVMTLLKLQSKIKLVKDPNDLVFVDKMKWSYHKTLGNVEKLVQQLRANINLLNLFLGILQHEVQIPLNDMPSMLREVREGVQSLLDKDDDLAERMTRLESCNLQARRQQPGSIQPEQETSSDSGSIITVRQATDNTQPPDSDRVSLTEASGLDRMLANFRVYRRADRRQSRFSMCDSVHQNWSIFTGLSLSAISNLSVIALPLTETELLDVGENQSVHIDKQALQSDYETQPPFLRAALEGLSFSDEQEDAVATRMTRLVLGPSQPHQIHDTSISLPNTNAQERRVTRPDSPRPTRSNFPIS